MRVTGQPAGRRTNLRRLALPATLIILTVAGLAIYLMTASTGNHLRGSRAPVGGVGPVGASDVTAYGARGDGVTNDAPAFQRAIDAVAGRGGTVTVPPPTVSYRLATTVQLASDVTISGIGNPLITGGVRGGYLFTARFRSNVHGLTVRGLSIDLRNSDKASGIILQNVQDVTIDGLTVRDVKDGWGINVGVGSTGFRTSTPLNHKITITNCLFDTIDSKLEQLLVFNAENVQVTKNHFTNVAFHPSGGSLGLYQNDHDFLISQNTFGPNLGNSAIYYAIGDSSLTVSNNVFEGSSSFPVHGTDGIRGANESDHGLFGQTTAQNLSIVNNQFRFFHVALQLGGVSGAVVTGDLFANNQVAIQTTRALILPNVSPNTEGATSTDVQVAQDQFVGNQENTMNAS